MTRKHFTPPENVVFVGRCLLPMTETNEGYPALLDQLQPGETLVALCGWGARATAPVITSQRDYDEVENTAAFPGATFSVAYYAIEHACLDTTWDIDDVSLVD